MLTIKDILTDKIVLDIECVDRVYLNGYVKYLQLPAAMKNPLAIRCCADGTRRPFGGGAEKETCGFL